MYFQNKKSNHHYIGALGEEIAKNYLESRGYKTVARNYRKKWGEIDIIMSYKNKLHFVEVKTMSVKEGSREWRREGRDLYRPEDRMHPFKIKRIHRAVQSFLGEGREERDWGIDLASVYLDIRSKKAMVEFLENVF